MEINITDKEVCNIILQKLKDKESLLITRIGDGEIVALKPDLHEKGTNHFYNANPHNNANRNLSEELNFDDSFSSAKLMEDYFIIKRKVSNVDFDDLVNNFIITF